MAPQMLELGRMERAYRALSPQQKRMLYASILSGSGVLCIIVRSLTARARAAQSAIFAAPAGATSALGKSRAARVDALCFRRLRRIMAVCIPGLFTKEAAMVALHSALLVARTLLTEATTYLEGRSARSLVALQFPSFYRWLGVFGVVTIPAAIVNAALKHSQAVMQLAFQERLALRLHSAYCTNRAYYAASVLDGLQGADQRITEDVAKFSSTVTDLFSYTFKPLLDLVLFTRSLSKVMGYRGQLVLYGYYLASGFLLKAAAPPLAQMVAHEAALSGEYRQAHQRIRTHAEEVAFHDPPAGRSEQLILNRHLRRLLRYAGASSLQRMVQQALDGYFIKYAASVVALMMYAAPLRAGRGTSEERVQDYIRSMRLLNITSKSVGDLVLVYKRVTTLAGHTSRVGELMEHVEALGTGQRTAQLFERPQHDQAKSEEADDWVAASDDSGEGMQPLTLSEPPSRVEDADVISFRDVGLDAPDGQPLIRHLTLEIRPHSSVMIAGPNGSGKSSLLRVLAGLWPLQAGCLHTPPTKQLMYLSQRPYLVSGSLADQIRYPQPPASVWAAASGGERAQFLRAATPSGEVGGAWSCAADGRAPGGGDEGELRRLGACLDKVELGYLVGRWGWHAQHDWQQTLSGGERQRIAMARLLFHNPRFAVLDECTSAVSSDGETKLYQALSAAGITMLSIAHRPALRAFHKYVLHFDGTQRGTGWRLEKIDQQAAVPSSP